MNDSQRNALRAYIKTDSGAAFLRLIADQEVTILAEGFSAKASTDTQIQKMNRAASLYWVRTLIQDLVKPKVNIRK